MSGSHEKGVTREGWHAEERKGKETEKVWEAKRTYGKGVEEEREMVEGEKCEEGFSGDGVLHSSLIESEELRKERKEKVRK